MVADPGAWRPLTADLSAWAGREVSVELEMIADTDGAIGLWGAPTLSGGQRPDRPNVILYVIDGGGAPWTRTDGSEPTTRDDVRALASMLLAKADGLSAQVTSAARPRKSWPPCAKKR